VASLPPWKKKKRKRGEETIGPSNRNEGDTQCPRALSLHCRSAAWRRKGKKKKKSALLSGKKEEKKPPSFIIRSASHPHGQEEGKKGKVNDLGNRREGSVVALELGFPSTKKRGGERKWEHREKEVREPAGSSVSLVNAPLGERKRGAKAACSTKGRKKRSPCRSAPRKEKRKKRA